MNTTFDNTPANTVAGALAHLAHHMETGCQRSAHLAAMLLDRIALDTEANPHLRKHARELVDILEQESVELQAAESRDARMIA